jgi:hypothetical protein
MFVKLSNELIKTLSIENKDNAVIVVSWTELKGKLKDLSAKDDDSEVIKLLKGSRFSVMLPEEINEEKIVTSEEYAKLISSSTPPTRDIHNEITQLRHDLAEVRRESTWLLNCFFSVIGTAVFAYFVVSFYFDKVESRLVCSLTIGMILFFFEVLLFIIRY